MFAKSIKKQTDENNMAKKSIKLLTDRHNMATDEITNSRSSSFWGLCCETGKKYSQIVKDKIHLTMAVLDSSVVPTSPVVSLMVDSAVEGGKPYILCNLKPGSLLQVNLNLLFDKGEKVTFSLKGQGQVHLSGYHIFDKVDSGSSEASAKGLPTSPIKNVATSPSKVEAQVKNQSPNKALSNKSEESKRNSVKEKLASKKETSNKKTLKKESKGESDDDSDDYEDLFEELEESSEDEESEEESDDDKSDLKKDSNKLESYKRLYSAMNPSEEEDESDSDESGENNEKVSSKIMKKNNSVSPQNKKLKNETGAKSTEVLNLDDDDAPKFSKKMDIIERWTKDDLLNSSIGKTPMPKKKKSKMNLSNDLSPKKVSFNVDEKSLSDSDKDMNVSQTSPSKQGQLTPPASESKKKRKKKKKASLNTSNASDAGPGPKKAAKTGLAAATYSQKLPGGLEYEDVRIGNGPLAKKGRLVHVYYTGMLENSKVFDSREPGNKPFSFKLGADQVIKGWDTAIEGMKVGGKRRMKIPASLGYQNQRMGPIPPNSTLYFNVELKSVS